VRPGRAQQICVFEGFLVADDLMQTGSSFVAYLP
jgi:hypothetical protein